MSSERVSTLLPQQNSGHRQWILPVSCSRIPLPVLYPERFQSFPKLSVLRMGWAGWSQLALSQVWITGSHLSSAPPCPLALFCGPGFGSTGHFCAPALEVRGKDTQGVGQSAGKQLSTTGTDTAAKQELDTLNAAAEPVPSFSPMRNPLSPSNCPQLVVTKPNPSQEAVLPDQPRNQLRWLPPEVHLGVTTGRGGRSLLWGAEMLPFSLSPGFFQSHPGLPLLRLSSGFRTDASKWRSSLIYLWYALTLIQVVPVH